MSSHENARLRGPSARLEVGTPAPGEDLGAATLVELEHRAEELRAAVARDPQHSTKELGDVMWEIEKRKWRNETWSYPNKDATKDEPSSA